MPTRREWFPEWHDDPFLAELVLADSLIDDARWLFNDPKEQADKVKDIERLRDEWAIGVLELWWMR